MLADSDHDDSLLCYGKYGIIIHIVQTIDKAHCSPAD